MSDQNLLSLSPQEFIEFLKRESITRFYFVYDHNSSTVKSSHSLLQPVADFLQNDKRDFQKHEGVFVQLSSKYDTLLGAFIHRTNRGQAAGGVRYWLYDTMEDYLRDGLRLAMGMTHKNAMAGLWWGGGKGVMAFNPDIDKQDPEIREYLYKEYGEFMTSLNGCYVTAEDAGTNVNDMVNIFSRTRFTTCIPFEVGGSGNPSVPTARGVVAGMEAASEFGDESLSGKTIAIQGLGNVGRPLVQILFDKNVEKIIAWDISPELIEHVKKEFVGKNIDVQVVNRTDNSMFGVECDVLSPNAVGAILNEQSIPKLKARIVCGAANNQLEYPVRDDADLNRRGITYIPDFLTNRMGIVNCADEQAGYVKDDPIIERHLSKDWDYSIHQMTLKVLRESRESGKPTNLIAKQIAERLSLEDNPVYGHRGRLIINSLIEKEWDKSR